ncbi:DNA-binding protein [Methylophilus sp. QUAN]|uniref:DNA-binding protein n=1 Tax=Methylophilus sp. QUAN TaxID=2781020 RepID=UPI00188F40ED|nr:DNA-binding protein [Methylophilus sp. QUAN]MBF4991868.1 DNA-binding protein [Methylophilus sp. QUAN]
MASIDIFEGKLIEDVEKLRAQFPQTKELYREVCSLLFFRYGIQPTANKLYQLIRKGTMATPAQAVSNFWIELREKSRVAIEHPGLPENVRDVAGNAFSVIWNAALDAANQNLESVKAEMDQLRIKCEKEASEAAIIVKKSLENTNQLAEEIRGLKNELLEANKKILVDTQILANQNKSLLELKNDNEKLEADLKNSQQEFSHEVNKMHASLRLSDERYRKLEAKTLMELDRERQRAAKIEGDLKLNIKAASKAQSSFIAQTAKSQKLINALRENIGLLKGQLKSHQKKNAVSKDNVTRSPNSKADVQSERNL